jgi:hypothetical protein
MKRILIVLTACLIAPAQAEITGAGDAAIVQQLVTLVKSTNEQLQEVRKTVSISERLEEMEQAKAVRRLAAEGKAMRELIKESEKLEGQLLDIKGDPTGSRRTQREIASLQYALDSAKERDGRGQAKAYSRLLADMKRLEFLGTAQKESMKKMASGANETDNTQVAATSSMIMSDLMLQREQQEQARKAQEVQAVESTLRSMQYSTMVMDDKEDN